MYWIFLIIFIAIVLVPDIVRSNLFFLSETRAEELTILLLGAVAFVIFIEKDQQLIFHKRQKERDQKKIDQTVKDLVESYSYIGEVNRKMDILTNIALGLSEQKTLTKIHEKETYASIVSAANSLMKADSSILKFINQETGKTEKEFHLEEKGESGIKNKDLLEMEENIHVKKVGHYLVVSSRQVVKGIKSYLLIKGFDREEENNSKNLEILKVFASQALFLFSYARQ